MKNMICWTARRRKTDFVDGRLRANERARLEAHLNECPSCSLLFEQEHSVRSALGDLPTPVSPQQLSTALRVKASQEAQAVLASRESRVARVWKEWRFRLDQIMRPLTIPATGGILSSLLLFSALAFAISTTSQIVSYEVPVAYADRAAANLVPLELRSSVMLTLVLDGNGRITDYSVRDGSASFVGDAARLQPKNISMPAFPSVLALAQPVNGDVSILFRPIVFRQ
ncbi:MAG: zf-HC2 domain-containing protein [Acidobacteriaceae bacterium]|nr:zf-HC2 domain-containing protein [Acidobacteriaceae bacterium]